MSTKFKKSKDKYSKFMIKLLPRLDTEGHPDGFKISIFSKKTNTTEILSIKNIDYIEKLEGETY